MERTTTGINPRPATTAVGVHFLDLVEIVAAVGFLAVLAAPRMVQAVQQRRTAIWCR